MEKSNKLLTVTWKHTIVFCFTNWHAPRHKGPLWYKSMWKAESQLFLSHSSWKERQDAKGFRQCWQQGKADMGFVKRFLNKNMTNTWEKKEKEGRNRGRQRRKERGRMYLLKFKWSQEMQTYPSETIGQWVIGKCYQSFTNLILGPLFHIDLGHTDLLVENSFPKYASPTLGSFSN